MLESRWFNNDWGIDVLSPLRFSHEVGLVQETRYNAKNADREQKKAAFLAPKRVSNRQESVNKWRLGANNEGFRGAFVIHVEKVVTIPHKKGRFQEKNRGSFLGVPVEGSAHVSSVFFRVFWVVRPIDRIWDWNR